MLKIMIEEDRKVVNSDSIILFDQPSYIFIPLVRNKKTYLPLIKKGEYVYQEEKIAVRLFDHFPLFSTVSGIVESVDTKGIVVRNDFKNRVRDHQIIEYDLTLYSKREISNVLFSLGIQNIGSDEVDPYQKLVFNRAYKYLIVNALKGEPYFYLESFQLKMERKPLLEMIDVLIDIYNFEEVLIVVPDTQTLLFEEWKYCIQNSKIKLLEMEEYYALASSRELVWRLKKISYQKDPLEKGIVIFNVSTLFSIYQALKYRRPQVRMLVQFTGDMWKKNCYMEVRIGTYLKEAVAKLEFKRAKEVILLAGSLVIGKPQDLESSVITTRTPLYSAWQGKDAFLTTSCTRCGSCMKVCPMHLSPVLIMDAVCKKRNVARFSVEHCIECGLCSCVCPSKIHVHEFVVEAKEMVLK